MSRFRMKALGLNVLACVVSVLTAAAPQMAQGHPQKPLDILYAFADQTDGSMPVLTARDRHGNLYGFAGGGSLMNCGAIACGTIFKMAPDGSKTILHSFAGSPGDGGVPTGLLLDRDGNFYGTTAAGGKDGYGTVFKLAPDGTETVLHFFKAPKRHYSVAPYGIWPQSGVIRGRDGNLYGTAWHGGINNHCGEGGCGLVFSLSPEGAYRVVYAFKGLGDGCAPLAGLVQDATGNLYGATNGCGHGNYGTVYKLDPTGAETVLHTFAEGADGNTPISTPVLDSEGNLYGGTLFGGLGCNDDAGCGVIYKIAPDGTETILYSFKSIQDGFSAIGGLHRDADGTIYGTTSGGGEKWACNHPNGCGTVFKLTPDGMKTTLHVFLGPEHGDGAFAKSALLPGTGKDRHILYGTTADGPGCCGMVFSIAK